VGSTEVFLSEQLADSSDQEAPLCIVNTSSRNRLCSARCVVGSSFDFKRLVHPRHAAPQSLSPMLVQLPPIPTTLCDTIIASRLRKRQTRVSCRAILSP
jgi:hypothetical protein